MTMPKSLLPWQYNGWHSLCRYIEQNRIPQGLLITGTKGIGKHKLAKNFATSLLCTQRENITRHCGQCRSCHLVGSNTHPDFIEIKPDEGKTVITVEQVRTLVADTYLKPQFAAYRVILISPADAMTISASNAFLKCLEEPAERTVFILLTSRLNKIPATVASRCQKIEMAYPDQTILLDWMIAQGIDQRRETLVKLLKSSVLTTGQLLNNDILKQRKDCFEDWLGIAAGETYPGIISDKWKEVPENELLNWLISWVSDLIKCVYGVDQKRICNLDFKESMQNLSKKLEIKRLYSLYSLLLNAKQLLGTQINFQIMTEEILVQWFEVNRRN